MQQFTLLKYWLTLAITAFGFTFGCNALADQSRWYLSAHTGLSQLSDTNGQTTDVSSVDGNATVDLNSGFLAGMAIGYQYNKNWAAEIAWEYRTNDSETILADGTVFNEGNYASNIFFVNGIYTFARDSVWEPYVGFGLGWVQEIDLDLEDENGEISFSGNGNVGAQLLAGMSYRYSEDWSLYGELRYSNFGKNDLDGEGIASGEIRDLEYTPLTFELGVSYRF